MVIGLKESLDYIRDLWLVGWLQKLPDWGQAWDIVLLSVTREACYLVRLGPLEKMRTVWRNCANLPMKDRY